MAQSGVQLGNEVLAVTSTESRPPRGEFQPPFLCILLPGENAPAPSFSRWDGTRPYRTAVSTTLLRGPVC